MSLFIPQTKELKELALKVNLTTEKLIEKLETGFAKNELELCDYEDAGKLFEELFKEMEVTASVFACFHLKRSDKDIDNLLSNLYFKNSLEDCPNCGCETTNSFDWNDRGNGTETKICGKCGDVDVEVTGWDKMERGVDY